MWKVYRTDEFKKWFNDLNLLAKESILKDIIILSTKGPLLNRPYVDTLKGSKISNFKELNLEIVNIELYFVLILKEISFCWLEVINLMLKNFMKVLFLKQNSYTLIILKK
jgi:hypothetical protein